MSFLTNILPKTQNKEYFLTIGVLEHKIIATVASISGKEVTIIGSGVSEFAEGSEETEAADIAISKAEEKIGENVLVQKVIFGLPNSLLDKDEIKPQHLERLKKITKTLSLVPCGFVEYSQALSCFLEAKEESPPTLLLLSIGTKQIAFSHIRVGKIENNFLAERTSSVAADFEKALANFTSSEILPSRIILFDESGQEEMDKLKEELLRFPWHKHSVFLHTPKIEALETEDLSFALAQSAARSFIKDFHIEKEKPEATVQPEEPIKKEETVEETFGFVKGDYSPEKPTQNENTEEIQDVRLQMIAEEVEPPQDLKKEGKYPFFQKSPALPKLPKFNLSRPDLKFIPAPLFILAFTIVLLIVSAFLFIWYYPAATVNLIIYPGSSVSNLDVTLTTDKDTAKTAKNSILTSDVFTDVTGDKTAPAMGKTQIGEKATGQVTIYNKTLSAKTFPKGTILLADTLKFTLDSDTTIASASDTGEGLTFGKTASKITAFEIGPEGNLSSGTNFYFQSYDRSSYYAKNAEKLTGGTSRDITSVSKEDQDNLVADLTEILISQAKKDLTGRLNPGERLLDNFFTNSITSKKFGHSIGEESKEESLTMSMKVSGLVYKDKDLLDLSSNIAAQVPQGFAIVSDKTNIKISQTSTDKKGNVIAKAMITYYFFPEIDFSKIQKEISGKSYAQADLYLSKNPAIGGFEVISERKLPLMGNSLPLQGKNIKLKLVSR